VSGIATPSTFEQMLVTDMHYQSEAAEFLLNACG
jgi:hypothetical protein